MGVMVRWVWLSLAAIGVGALSWGSYTLWAMLHAMPIKPTAKGQELVDGFDVIAIQLDILTLAITAVGIVLGIAAIFGYQAMRDASVGMAKNAAEDVATRVIAEHIEKLEAWKRGFAASHPQAAVDPGEAVEMRGDESNGGPSGGRAGNQAAPRKRPRADG